MKYYEVNFDGLVGPSHHYAGLSHGNLASKNNSMGEANPKAAALQGLKKMKTLADLGQVQAFLPPHMRPNLTMLRRLGFSGYDDQQIVEQAWKTAPEIAANCFSASSMWVANATTVSPSPDTHDGRVHFTAANLCRMFHRSFESEFTAKLLQAIFADKQHFTHHQPLPAGHYFGDEGAANHTRLGSSHAAPGVELFVYGEQTFGKETSKPKKYPSRQSLEASQAIARLHGLDENRVVFAQQNPDVIDAGVFHNDVIAVGTTNLLFFHEQAFLNTEQVVSQIKQQLPDGDLHEVMVPESAVSVQEAVSTYLFNTQLIDISAAADNSDFILIAPIECQENQRVADYLQSIEQSDVPISKLHYFNLRESMKNGGGPACLRLRVVLSEQQLASINPNLLINDRTYSSLVAWVEQHYRDSLSFADLRDPQLLIEIKQAMFALQDLLGMESLYG